MKKASKRILSLLLCLVLCVGLLPAQALAAEELPADILAELPEDEQSSEDEVLPEESPEGQPEESGNEVQNVSTNDLDVQSTIGQSDLEAFPKTDADTNATAQGASFISRSDGVWFWPLPGYYNSFSDWAGCPGWGNCPFCGVPHSEWGDNEHNGQYKGHNGFDVGTGGNKCAVYAAAAGTAYCVNYHDSRGNYIVIEHPAGTDSSGQKWSYYSYYQHLSAFTISNGTAVKAGQTIGNVGDTGSEGSVHLHFGMVLGHSGLGASAVNLDLQSYGLGWVCTPGFKEGRILVNPALNSPMGFPTGTSAVVPPLKAHAGSIMFTNDASKVSIGDSSTKTIKLITHLNYSGKNYLYGGDFDTLDSEHWRSRDTSVSTISIDSATKHNGYNSLKIVNSSAGGNAKDLDILTQTSDTYLSDLGSGVGDAKSMILSFWAKASNDGATIYWRWGYEENYHPVTLTTSWAKYTVRMDKKVYFDFAMHPYVDRAGTVWLSEMQLEDGTSATSFVPEKGGKYQTTTQTCGQKYKLPAAPSRTGYTFAGWYTAASGGSQITSSMTVDVTGDLPVYAHWTANNYTVTFNANGGSVSPGSKTVTYGQSYGSLPTPTRSGFTFDGWYTAASGGSRVTDSTTVTTASNHTLYAHWTAITFTVMFNANGGSVSLGSKTVYLGSAYGDLPSPTRTGYTFAGWYTAADGGTQVTSSTTVTTASNHTLYAHWTAKTIYLRTFLNYSGKNYFYGGDFAELDPENWYSRDTSVTTISVDSSTTHNGYNSLKIDNASAGESGKDLAIMTQTSDINLPGYGDGVGDNKAMILSFWAKASNDGTKMYWRWGYEGEYRSVTLTTDWAKYTVAMEKTDQFGYAIHPYVDRAGTVWLSEMQIEDGTTATDFVPEHGGKYQTTAETYGEKYTLPTAPTRTGYNFAGWYTAAAGGTQITADSLVSVTGDLPVYAHWTRKTAQISVRPMGGTWNGSESRTDLTAEYGSRVDLGTPTRNGYAFKGWMLDVDTNGYTLEPYGAAVQGDPMFRNSMGNVWTYNNAQSGQVTLDRVASSADCPTDSDYMLRITVNGSDTSPGLGGCHQYKESKPGGVFYHTIAAKIPVGYTLEYAANAVGDGSTFEWLTPHEGTGAFELYTYVLRCSTTGTFHDFGYLYLDGPKATAENPVTWDIAYSQMFDATDLTMGSGNALIAGSETAALLPFWKQEPTQITILPMGGTWNGSSDPTTITVDEGTRVDLGAPTREGYTFEGWLIDNNVGGYTLEPYGCTIHQDPMFRNSTAGIIAYNTADSGSVAIERVARSADCPTDSDYMLRVITNGAAQPALGGFNQSMMTEPGAVFYHTIVAKIPVGYQIEHAENAVGDNPSFTWLTSTKGTGKFEVYTYRLECSSTGTFDSFGYIYLNGPEASAENPVSWDVAYSQMFNATGLSMSGNALKVGSGTATVQALWKETEDLSVKKTVNVSSVITLPKGLVGFLYTDVSDAVEDSTLGGYWDDASTLESSKYCELNNGAIRYWIDASERWLEYSPEMTVNVPVTSITMNSEIAKLKVGEKVYLRVTVLPSQATDKTVIWTSSDESIVTLEDKDTLWIYATAVSVGNAVITATVGDKTATCAITVLPDNVIDAGYCGANEDEKNLAWVLYDDGRLVISGEGKMKNYDGGNIIVNGSAPWRPWEKRITTVEIESGVTNISSGAFCWCSAIETISIPDTVTRIESTSFFGAGLKKVILPESVVSIGFRAFEASTLEEITIPSGVNNTYIGWFNRCSQLRNITVAEGNPTLSSVDGVLYSKDHTTLYVYPACKPDTSFSVPAEVTSVYYGAFRGSQNLERVELNQGLQSIGQSAFAGSGITEITIPESVTSIDSYAFSGCKDLREITVLGAITTIVYDTFVDCTALRRITLPASVTEIGEKAFQNCTSLTDVYFGGSREDWDAVSIGSDNEPLLNATKHFALDPLSITAQPQNYVGPIGSTAVFHVEASGYDLSYKWQYHKAGVSSWANTTVSGHNTDTISFPVTAKCNGLVYRCVITDGNGKSVTTDSVTLTVGTVGPEITAQPEDFVGPIGSTAVFHVEAEGEGLTYKWQFHKAGVSSWSNTTVTGCKTDTISFTVTAKCNGLVYRCVITDAAGNSVTSDTATLTVGTLGPEITAQPEDFVGPIGSTAVFHVEASGEGLMYKWQFHKAGATRWTNTTVSGYNTDTISFTVTAKCNGLVYRCVITDAAGNSVTSDTATLTVGTLGPEITAQPEDFVGPIGSTAVFHVEASGEGLTYKWQFHKATATRWTNTTVSGHDTDTISFPVTAKCNGLVYRCVITDAAGNTVITDTATLTVGTLGPEITAQPEDFVGPIGSTAVFHVEASGEGLTYKWQFHKATATRWTNTTVSGHDTDTISFPVTAKCNGLVYRCVITDAAGNTVITDTATLTVEGAGTAEFNEDWEF